MLEIKNVEVFGANRAILASGNAMTTGEINTASKTITDKDLKRVLKLGSAKPGSAHDSFLKGITVYMDIKYPLYWSPEAQRYHWFEIITSQSTMHRLNASVQGDADPYNKYVFPQLKRIVKMLVDKYNADPSYKNFMLVRSNLPWGYEMWETVVTNYQQLKTMYAQRVHHKLQEDWGAFIDMCNKLPLFKDLTGV